MRALMIALVAVLAGLLFTLYGVSSDGLSLSFALVLGLLLLADGVLRLLSLSSETAQSKEPKE